MRYDEFTDNIDVCDNLRTSIDAHDLNDVNIKAERDDPDYR